MRKILLLFTAIALAAVALVFTACSGKKMKTETLIVASSQGDCVGVAPQKCLLIMREGENTWEYWYDGIEGFDYEPGYEYVILIHHEKIENPPADRPNVRYVLDKMVSKTEKESVDMPQPARPMP